MTRSALLAVCFLFTAGFAGAAETSEYLRGIMRAAMKKYQASSEKRHDYLYVLHTESREFDGDGQPRAQQSALIRREAEGEFVVTRVVERDGLPITEDERQKNEERIRKSLAELRALSPPERQRRDRERRQRRSSEDAWIAEFPEALDYKQIGEEMVNGRAALVLECWPRPGYKPSNMRARVFEKTRGKVWVDKAENELVKADAEVFDTVNVGFGLVGKIEKGTRFRLERQKTADGTWMPVFQAARFAARFMLVKSLNREFTLRYSDYRLRPTATEKAAR